MYTFFFFVLNLNNLIMSENLQIQKKYLKLHDNS